jgi:hypothetical protein
MAKLIEKKTVSDHVMVSAFPAAAEKDDLVAIGSLIGIADITVEAGKPGSVDVGKEVAVFQAKAGDFSGTAAVGTDVYVNAGALAPSGGTLFGTITAVVNGVIDIARV